jgi:probable addiction module antidote protein
MADHDFPHDDPTRLTTLEAVAGYLAAAFEAGDADALVVSLSTVARSDGLAHLAAAAGLPRAELAASLEAGELSLETTLAIMKVIDLHLP